MYKHICDMYLCFPFEVGRAFSTMCHTHAISWKSFKALFILIFNFFFFNFFAKLLFIINFFLAFDFYGCGEIM